MLLADIDLISAILPFFLPIFFQIPLKSQDFLLNGINFVLS